MGTNYFFLSFFLDLAELDGGTSDSIISTVLKTLSEYQFTNECLSSHVCSDGASEMVGQKSVVLIQTASKHPKVIHWNWLCHRIELSISDAVDEFGGVNHCKAFIDKVFTLYIVSLQKNRRELAASANKLNVQLHRICQIFTVRWVASSYRNVSAGYCDYSALLSHVSSAAADLS